MKSLLKNPPGSLFLGVVLVNPEFAQEPVKIGMVTTLCRGDYLAQNVHGGFLRLEEKNGKLVSVPAQVLVKNDVWNPMKGH
jgi:hypothetical protein